jgi:site-specific recombinase XerD
MHQELADFLDYCRVGRRLLLALFAYAGLRRSELLGLGWDDVDLASELLRAGANLRQIQELLGHKHLDSTQRYTRVTGHELRGAVKRLRWAGERPPGSATSGA